MQIRPGTTAADHIAAIIARQKIIKPAWTGTNKFPDLVREKIITVVIPIRQITFGATSKGKMGWRTEIVS